MLRIFKSKSKSASDADLIKRYQDKQHLSDLGELYERYMNLVYGVCLKYLNDKGASEDAVMAIFEELVEKVKKHEISNFKSWLHVLTKNYCLGQLRKQNNKSSLTVIYDTEVMQSSELSHHEEEGEEETFDASQHEALKTCIELLKGDQKQCIEQFYFEGKSYKDIAAETGMEIGKVRSYIQNGKRNLKNCIEQKTKASLDAGNSNSDNTPKAELS